MKKLIAILAVGMSLVGCASSPPQFDPYTAFGSWYPLLKLTSGKSIGQYALVEPSSKMQVADGVFSVYYKTSGSSEMTIYLANCYTREIAAGRIIDRSPSGVVTTTNLPGTFSKAVPDTVGWALYKYLCK